MRMMRAAILAALFVVAAVAGRAEDVTLTSRDGNVAISGTLLAFDGEFYRLDTIYGELTVDGSGVTCAGPGCPNLDTFVVEVVFSGAATIAANLMPALLEGFAQETRGAVKLLPSEDATEQVYLLTEESGRAIARFVLRTRTSAEGFADLLANEADIILSTREIRPAERKRAMDAGFGDLAARGRSRVLALDALVPIVHPDNPLSSVSVPDLADVLSGRLTDWSALGGVDAPVSLKVLSPNTGLAQRVEDQILVVRRQGLSADAQVHDGVDDVVRAVLRDPFGLAVVGYSNVGAAKPLALEGGCGFALAANARTLKTEDYPLTAPQFLYFPARRLPKPVRDFLRFTRSAAAQRIVFEQGFIDQAQESFGIDVQGVRLANAIRLAGGEIALGDVRRMVSTLYELRRLTTTFRFETGATQLDAQSRSNVAALAEALERGAFDARRLVFVGFSDGEGSAEANLRIAQRRAEEVRAAVRDAAEVADFDAVTLDVEAFGEALPMACDDSAWGRQTNRRVEVWVDR